MNQEARTKLDRVAEIRRTKKALDEEEKALVQELIDANPRGIRTALAEVLGVTLETLRNRYGSVPSATRAVRAAR